MSRPPLLPRRRIGLAVALALLGGGVARADDDPLEDARSAVELLKFPAARAALARALGSGSYGPDELAEIYRLSGMVEASLGHAAEATENFKRLLALEPGSKLDPGTSPKITKPFAAAAAYYRSHDRLRVKIETEASPPSVTLVVQSDPLHMVAGANVSIVVDGQTSESRDATGSGRIKLALPEAKRLALRVSAVDARGNRLIDFGSASEPIEIVAPKEEPKTVEHVTPPPPASVRIAKPHGHRPFYARWPMWAGVSVALLATGTYFGLAARSTGDQLDDILAHSTQHDYGETRDLESRLSQQALLANISFGVAGAAALASGVLYLLEPRGEPTVAATPTRGGAMMALQVRF